jgi:hypothetical protein
VGAVFGAKFLPDVEHGHDAGERTAGDAEHD